MEITVGEKRVTIEGNTLKVAVGSTEEVYDLSKLEMIGARRRFSRILLLLSVASAILGVLNADNLLYIVLAVLIFLSVIVLREEGIVLVFEDRDLVLSPLDRRKRNELMELFKGYLVSSQ
jgi:hypothetical protein